MLFSNKETNVIPNKILCLAIEIEGAAEKIKYENKYTTEDQLKYSHAPVHWKKFVDNLKGIYFSVRDAKK